MTHSQHAMVVQHRQQLHDQLLNHRVVHISAGYRTVRAVDFPAVDRLVLNGGVSSSEGGGSGKLWIWTGVVPWAVRGRASHFYRILMTCGLFDSKNGLIPPQYGMMLLNVVSAIMIPMKRKDQCPL